MSNAVLIGGGAAVVAFGLASRGSVNAAPSNSAAITGVAPLSGVSVSLQAAVPKVIAGAGKTISVSPYVMTGTSSAGNTTPKALADAAQREIEEYVKKNVDALSADAKKKGAAALNQALKLNPPLKGTETYKDIARIAGSAAAAAGCSAVPGGATVAPLCAIAGAYLGVKGADLAKKAASYTVEAAKKVANAVGNAASSVWNSIF